MCGAKPVFADVDEQTFNIHPAQVEERITPQDKSRYRCPPLRPAVRCAGNTGQVCESHSLKFIEDAAQAHGAMYKGEKVGGFGHLGLLLLLCHEEYDHR